MGVGDIVREVKTIFTADVTAMKRELAAVEQASKRATKETSALQREVDQTLKEIDHILKTPTSIQKGFINTAGKNKFFDEFSEVDKGLNDILHGDKKRMADPWMLDELDRMRAAAVKAKPAIVDLGTAAKAATETAVSGFSGFKQGVQGTLGPLKFLRENLAFVGLGAFGVIEGIGSVIEYLNRASPATLEWGKSLRTLGQDYRDFRRFVEEQETRRGNIRPDTEPVRRIKDARKQIFGGDPDPDDETGKKNAGFWQKAAEREKAAVDIYEETVHRARLKGFKVSKEGQLELDTSSLTPTQKFNMSRDQNFVSRALEEQRALSRDLKRNFDSMGFAAKQRQEVEKENARLLWEQSWAAADLLGKLNSIKSVGSIVVEGVGKGITDLVDQVNQGVSQNFASLKTEKERKEDFGKGLAKLLGIDLKHGKTGVHVDARGSKIQVTTHLETDDPGRFANVALKSAFLGAVARPLSATMALGSPSIGGAR